MILKLATLMRDPLGWDDTVKGWLTPWGVEQELELIESESSNQVEWFGEVGFQNMVRLDKSLNKNYVKAVKINNDRIKFEKVKITKI